MGLIGLRITGWTLQRHQYTRIAQAGHRKFQDAFELCCNFRGVGWDWGIRIPKPRSQWSTLAAVYGYVFQALLFEAMIILRDNLFDPSYPLWFRRPLQALIYPTATYAHLQGYYHLYSLLGVHLFRQSPDLWPPLFDAPWRATSLSEFWGRRWHQGFRDMFGRVVPPLGGRAGRVFGAFLVSGVFHDAGIWGLRREIGLCCGLTPYFVMNAVGIILEAVWPRKVGGWAGRIWMVTWLLGWAVATMSEECMKDFYGSFSINWVVRPVYLLYCLFKLLM